MKIKEEVLLGQLR